MNLPVIDYINKDHFLSIDKTPRSPTLEELMSNIPTVKEDITMNKGLAIGKGKDKDKVQRFDRPKVRMEVICDGCNANQYLNSNKMVGAKGGPKNLTRKSFRDGRREVTCVVPRYYATSFMFRGNCFVVNILSHNIKITWVRRK